eukprot:1616843-Rhodomonas_salina.1
MLHAKGFSSRPAMLQDLQRFVQRAYLQNLQLFKTCNASSILNIKFLICHQSSLQPSFNSSSSLPSLSQI